VEGVVLLQRDIRGCLTMRYWIVCHFS